MNGYAQPWAFSPLFYKSFASVEQNSHHYEWLCATLGLQPASFDFRHTSSFRLWRRVKM